MAIMFLDSGLEFTVFGSHQHLGQGDKIHTGVRNVSGVFAHCRLVIPSYSCGTLARFVLHCSLEWALVTWVFFTSLVHIFSTYTQEFHHGLALGGLVLACFMTAMLLLASFSWLTGWLE